MSAPCARCHGATTVEEEGFLISCPDCDGSGEGPLDGICDNCGTPADSTEIQRAPNGDGSRVCNDCYGLLLP